MASHSPLLPTDDEDFDAVSGPLKPRKPRSPNKNSNNAKLTSVVPVGSLQAIQPNQPAVDQNQAADTIAEQVDVDVKSTQSQQSQPNAQPKLVAEPVEATELTGPVVSEVEAQNETQSPAPTIADPSEITHQLYIPDSDELDDDVEGLFAGYVPTNSKTYEKPAVAVSFATEPAFVAPREVVAEPVAIPAEPIAASVTVPELLTPVKPIALAKRNRARRMPSMPSLPHIGGKRLVFEAALILAVIGLVGVVNKTNHQKQQVQANLSSLRANPEVALQQQTDNLINTVGQLVSLPSGETPTVANVSNAEQAKQQSAFFANAQNGDKVLMYVKAKQAILYRPATDNIILVAPLTFNNSAQTQASSGTTTLPTSKAASSPIKP